MLNPTMKAGTKLHMRLESKLNDSSYVLESTYEKKADGEAFLISVPMRNDAVVLIEEADKVYINYSHDERQFEIEGYIDGYVKKGRKQYLKIRRTITLQHFNQRVEARIKVRIRVKMEKNFQSKENLSSTQEIPGLTMDISGGGVSVYLNIPLSNGEIVEMNFPKIKDSPAISAMGKTCWVKENEKDNTFRYLIGFKFTASDDKERESISTYVKAVSEIMEG